MRVEEIKEGKSYVDGTTARYFRTVEMIVNAPKRPGGRVVAWSTSGFNVLDRAGRMHGKCGIATFAKWAKAEAK